MLHLPALIPDSLTKPVTKIGFEEEYHNIKELIFEKKFKQALDNTEEIIQKILELKMAA